MNSNTIKNVAIGLVVILALLGLYFYLRTPKIDPKVQEKIEQLNQRILSLDETIENFGIQKEVHREVVERKVEIIRETIPEYVKSLSPDELVAYTKSTISRFRERSRDRTSPRTTRMDGSEGRILP